MSWYVGMVLCAVVHQYDIRSDALEPLQRENVRVVPSRGSKRAFAAERHRSSHVLRATRACKSATSLSDVGAMYARSYATRAHVLGVLCKGRVGVHAARRVRQVRVSNERLMMPRD